jgi:biotin carboxyl carrier protein
MYEKTSLLLEQKDGEWLLRAPLIGRFSLSVGENAILAPGSSVGHVDQLHQRRTLVVPDDTPLLQVTTVSGDVHQASRGYGELILSCEPVATGEGEGAVIGGSEDEADLEFKSPMAGQFYRRPSPDDPEFASVGDVLEPGDQIGLVEVMKFFYPLELEAPAGKYELLEFRAEDSTSIDAGTVVATFEKVE